MSYNMKEWRYRVQILDGHLEDTFAIKADTHPDHDGPLDASFVALGTTALMRAVSEIIHDFHDAPDGTLEGATVADLMRRIPTLRVYLTAHGGRTSLRIPYTANGNTEMLARLSVERPDVV